MSDSVKKYHELLEEGRKIDSTYNQISTMTIVEILRASDCAGNMKVLLRERQRYPRKVQTLPRPLSFKLQERR